MAPEDNPSAPLNADFAVAVDGCDGRTVDADLCLLCVAQAPMARGQVLAIAKLTNMGQGKHGDKAKQVRMTTHCASSLAPQCSCAPSAVVLLWWPLGCRR